MQKKAISTSPYGTTANKEIKLVRKIKSSAAPDPPAERFGLMSLIVLVYSLVLYEMRVQFAEALIESSNVKFRHFWYCNSPSPLVVLRGLVIRSVVLWTVV